MLLTSYRVTPPVYRLRPGTVLDSDGDPVESWDAPDRFKLAGAVVQDVSTVEEEGVSKQIVKGERTLFVPRRVDLKADDRIEVEGEQWRVNGDPVTKAGLASGVLTTAALTRVESR